MSYSSAVPAEKLQIDPGYQERSLTIEALQKRIPEFVSASVMQPAPANRVTTTYIHGEYEMQHRGVQIMNVNG